MAGRTTGGQTATDAEMWISAVAEDQLCGLLVYRCDSFVEADIRPASGLGFLMRGLGPAMAQVLHLHICKGTVPTAGSSPGVGGEISLCQQVGKWSRRSASQSFLVCPLMTKQMHAKSGRLSMLQNGHEGE